MRNFKYIKLEQQRKGIVMMNNLGVIIVMILSLPLWIWLFLYKVLYVIMMTLCYPLKAILRSSIIIPKWCLKIDDWFANLIVR